MNRKLLLRFVKTIFALTIVFTLAAFGVLSTQNASAQGSQGPTIPGDMATLAAQVSKLPTNQIIIQYRNVSAAYLHPAETGQIARLRAASGVSLEYYRPMSGDAHVLRLPARLPLDQVKSIAKRLMSLPEVAYAEPDQVKYRTLDPAVSAPAPVFRPLALTPNDPLFAKQWDLKSAWGINAPTAWNTTTGVASVVVAVIDTGITNHAEFVGRTVPGYDFIADPLVANDGGGRDNNPSDPGDWITAADSSGATYGGWFEGCPVDNSSWHGTHTAGTIGAKGNNSLGVAGINWNSKIEPVRVLGKCGGYDSDIVDGMRWSAGLAVPGVPANAHPAKVLSISLGGSGACSSTYQTAINQINARGAVVVVAAGNSASDASLFTPGNCNGVITVAATGYTGDLTYYSNYGSKIEISAPGGEQYYANDPHGVLSTLNTGLTSPVADTYIYYQGTSMATPHVSGVVSLLFSLNPALTPAQVLTILQTSAKPFPGGGVCNTSLCGSGILDAGAAIAQATITISGNTGAAGTSLNYVSGSAKTAVADGSGNYTFNVPYNWGGTVTPVDPHHVYSPDHMTYANLVADQPGQNYTAAPIWLVSGNVHIAGATLSYTDGTPKTVAADGAGNYSFTVSDDWADILTPSKIGVAFTPASIDFSSAHVMSDRAGQDFTTDQVVHTISGRVSAAGATLSFDDDGPQTVLSDSLGNYSLLVSDDGTGWDGAITPSRAGITFTPATRDYASTPVTGDLTGQNFTANQSFTSIGAQDGWILESTETSGIGGTLDAAGNTFQLGDDALNRQYRAILSFNTGGLPDNAVIQSALLKIKQNGSPTGANPFSVLGNLWIDIRLGAFGANALQLGDFNTAGSASKVSIFSKTPVGGWYTNNIKAVGFSKINRAGMTQFRLYFGTDDNNNLAANYMKFLSGNYTSNQPLLLITYTLP